MKEYKLGENTICVANGDSNAEAYFVYEGKLYCTGNFYIGLIKICCLLPKGNWTLLGKASSITEQQAKGLVTLFKENVVIDWDIIEGKIYGDIYTDYLHPDWNEPMWEPFYTALDSFNSWLTANGIDKSNSIILIKE